MIKFNKIIATCFLFVISGLSFAQSVNHNSTIHHDLTFPMKNELKVATFGAGCFWCVEAVFGELKGVKKVVSGYMGGNTAVPTYKSVCTGTTGYAEVCQITFDPHEISYEELLQVFWKVHDPTTLNSQGADHGTQYRSVIFYHDVDQKLKAEHYKKELDKIGAYANPIVTEISTASKFFVAEDYHQDYYSQNSSQPYCKFVIQPKLDKFKKAFANKLKH